METRFHLATRSAILFVCSSAILSICRWNYYHFFFLTSLRVWVCACVCGCVWKICIILISFEYFELFRPSLADGADLYVVVEYSSSVVCVSNSFDKCIPMLPTVVAHVTFQHSLHFDLTLSTTFFSFVFFYPPSSSVTTRL